MNPRLAYPNDTPYFRKIYKLFKPGEYVYVFEMTYGELKAIGRLRRKERTLFKKYTIVSDESDPEYIKGFKLNKVKNNEIVYFAEPEAEKYFPNTFGNDPDLRISPRILYFRKDTHLVGPEEMLKTCEKNGWESLPLLFEGRYNPDYVINLNHGPSRYNPAVSRAGAILINDSGRVAFLPNQYGDGQSGFKQWIRIGGYRR